MFDKIKGLMERRGLTEYRFRKEAGFGKKTVLEWRRGIHEPSLKSLARLAAFFRVPIEYFFEDKTKPTAD